MSSEHLLGRMWIERRAAAAAPAALHREAGGPFCRHLPAVVVFRGEFEILAARASIRLLVLDAHVRKLDMTVDHAQVMGLGPALDVGRRPLRPSRGAAVASIGVL